MTFLTTLVTTFSGMQTFHYFSESLESAFTYIAIHILETYPYTDEIATDTINSVNTHQEIDEMPIDLNQIPDVSEADFAFKKTNDSIIMWFRYNDGDIFVTINDVSDQVTLNSSEGSQKAQNSISNT